MKKNIGSTERTIRLAIGVAFLAGGLLAPVEMTGRIVLLAVAAIALITAFVSTCPLWHVLGINTRREEDKTTHGHHEAPLH